MIPGRTRSLILWATIPYLLLSGSERATMQTRVYLNGTGARTVEVAANRDREEHIVDWLQRSSIGLDIRTVNETGVTVTKRSSRMAANLDGLGQEIRLQIQDIAQRPLTLYTYYFWHEDLTIEPDAATAVELVGRPQACLDYEIVLPGRVLPDSVSPAGEVEGGKVTWRLPADVPEQQVQATSRAFRWGYLLLVLYILAFIVYRSAVYIDRVLEYRPRKI